MTTENNLLTATEGNKCRQLYVVRAGECGYNYTLRTSESIIDKNRFIDCWKNGAGIGTWIPVTVREMAECLQGRGQNL